MATPQARPPARPPAAGKPDMSTVMANLGNLFAMDRDGKLAPTQVLQLISVQTRQIVLTTILKNQGNPLTSLEPHLDPSNSYNNHPPLISREAFQINVQNATAEANRLQANIIPLAKLKEMLATTNEERIKMFDADPTLKHKFTTSVTWYTKGVAGFPAPGRAGSQPASGASTPRPTQPAVRPTSLSTATTAATAFTSTDPTTVKTEAEGSTAAAAAAGRTSAPAQVTEAESARKKRKMVEYLSEIGPGLEYELGVTDVWEDVLDSFVKEAGRGAAKLAKHRGSEKVGVKDLSFFLNETYGITVPGFNAQIPRHVHLGTEDRRRKAVAPRAARMARPREDEA